MARPAAALVARRAVAAVIDGLLAALICAPFAVSRVGWFFAARAVVMLRIDSPDTVWRGAIPMLLGIVGTFVYAYPLALALEMLIEPLAGRSPGKLVMGLRVVAEPGARAARARWGRAALKSLPAWIMVGALLAGWWELAVLAVAAGTVGFLRLVRWALDGTATPHDVAGGTDVTTSSYLP